MNQQQTAPQSEHAKLSGHYATGRNTLIFLLVFTVINIVMVLMNSESYFLFSATIPYFLVYLGLFLTGRLPEDFYTADLWTPGEEFYPSTVLYVFVAVAVVILALYLLSFIFSSKNRYGWLIAALVFFVFDTVAMLYLYGIAIDSAFDILFHGWVLFDLFRAVRAARRLKTLPPEEQIIEITATELPTDEAEKEEESL